MALGNSCIFILFLMTRHVWYLFLALYIFRHLVVLILFFLSYLFCLVFLACLFLSFTIVAHSILPHGVLIYIAFWLTLDLTFTFSSLSSFRPLIYLSILTSGTWFIPHDDVTNLPFCISISHLAFGSRGTLLNLCSIPLRCLVSTSSLPVAIRSFWWSFWHSLGF